MPPDDPIQVPPANAVAASVSVPVASPSGKFDKAVEWVAKVLALLVIPLIGWGIKLEVNLAVKDQEIATVQRDVLLQKVDYQSQFQRFEKELEKTKTIQESIQVAFNNNTVSLARLEEKLNAANHNLSDILDRLRK